jgi:hypothetical protein
MVTAAGNDARFPNVSTIPPGESKLNKIEYWREKQENSRILEADFRLFQQMHPDLFAIPAFSPTFGPVPTNLDVMLWLQQKYAPGSSLLMSQGELVDAPIIRGKREKAAPCYTVEEVVAGERIICTEFWGEYYISNVFHRPVREDRWRHPDFVDSCTRNLDTRWLKRETFIVFGDAEFFEDGKRVRPTPDQRAAFVKYCIEHGATALFTSPHGMHWLIVTNRPVPIDGKRPLEMKSVMEWFFRDFQKLSNSGWKVDMTACVNRARLERVCPLVYWRKDAVIEIPDGVIGAVVSCQKERKHSPRSPQCSKSSAFGSSGPGSVSGAQALRMRCAALHYNGVEHVNTGTFIARVASAVGLAWKDIEALFEKFPVTSESFGPLDVEVVTRDIVPQSTAWSRQKTKALYAKMAWVYFIFHHETGCSEDELFSLFKAFLNKPVVSATAHLPPPGPEMPSHILLHNDRPQVIYEEAVFTAFGVTRDDLVDLSNPQVIKALSALGLAEKDPKHEEKLCNMLEQAASLMGGNKAFLDELKPDIARCSKKYRSGIQKLASKRRIRIVLNAIAKLANAGSFTTSQLIKLVGGKLCQYGIKKLSKADQMNVEAAKARGEAVRKIKTKRPRKDNVTQAVYRVLVQLEKDGMVTRQNPSPKSKNKAGRGAGKWGITTMAAESGKWLKTNRENQNALKKECLKHKFVKDGVVYVPLQTPKAGNGRSVKLSPVFELGQWFVGARSYGKGLLTSEVPMLVHAIRGYKANSGTDMWQIEGFMPISGFGFTAERFAPEIHKAGWVRVRDLHIAQFACPMMSVPDGNGGQRELKPYDTYSAESFALELSLTHNKTYTQAWLKAAPARYDVTTDQFNPADEVQTQGGLIPELAQPAVIAWVKQQRFLDSKRADSEKAFNKIATTAISARAETNPVRRVSLENEAAERLGTHYDSVPNGIIRWAVNEWQPYAEKTSIGRLLRDLQKFHRRKQPAGRSN